MDSMFTTGTLSSVVDPNTLNLDPDPKLWSNLDPDPGLPVCYQFQNKNFETILEKNNFHNLL